MEQIDLYTYVVEMQNATATLEKQFDSFLYSYTYHYCMTQQCQF